jgi:hypothetical protein
MADKAAKVQMQVQGSRCLTLRLYALPLLHHTRRLVIPGQCNSAPVTTQHLRMGDAYA